VLDGTVTLPTAYDTTNDKRTARAEDERKRATLAAETPDLDGTLSFAEAWAAYLERTRTEWSLAKDANH
jgi:hypothetical protein